MRCCYPILLRHPLSKRLFKVPCGYCTACRMNHARMWSIRCMHENKCWDDSVFVTLTYDEEHLPGDSSVHKETLQNFFKRLRKTIEPRKCRYFACGEYGGVFGRPHYHSIIFGLSECDRDIIEKCWSQGFITVGEVTPDSCNYVAGYVLKKQKGKKGQEYYDEKGIEPEFVLMSRRPGIGEQFMREHFDSMASRNYIYQKGFKFALPRYYEEKLHPRDEDFEYYEKKMEKVLEKEKKDIDRWREERYDVVEEAMQREVNLKARLGLKEKR